MTTAAKTTLQSQSDNNIDSSVDVRQVKKQINLSGQHISSILKSNTKAIDSVENASITGHINNGQKHIQQNRNSQQHGQALAVQKTTRTYASTKPSQRQLIQRSRGGVEASASSTEQSYKQTRAMSRRKVPSHLFDLQQIDQQQQEDTSYLGNSLNVFNTAGDHNITLQYASQGNTSLLSYGNEGQDIGQNGRGKQKTIKISRDNIQPPQSQYDTQAHPSQSITLKTTRQGSTIKRRSILTQNFPSSNVSGFTKATMRKNTSRNTNQNETTQQVQQRIKKQISTLKILGSLDNLNVAAEMQSQQRKNSSLSRDQSIARGRKSVSNPRQKINSNLRSIQTQNLDGRVRIQKTLRENIGQKYGYKHGGPIEAYQTANQTPHYHKIQISQEVNPMNLQHLSSIERAGSIDSGGYDQSQKTGIRNLQKGSPLKENIKSYSKRDQGIGKLNLGQQGFSEMLKQTIMSQAAAQQNNLSTEFLDSDLEAVLLSLDQSQVTQNMMKEFMNARNDINPKGKRKGSMPSSIGDVTMQQSIGNSRLESLIQQLIVRKEITQSPNIQQRRAYNTGNITQAHHSLQAANHIKEVINGKRTVQKVTNLNNFLHGGSVVRRQEHSVEDLLRIGREQDSAAASPNQAQTRIPVKNVTIKTSRPSAQQNQHSNVASFGQISIAKGITTGDRPHTNFMNQTDEINMSDTFGFHSNGQQTQVIAEGTQGFSAMLNSATKETHYQNRKQAETNQTVELYSDLYKDNIRHKFMSLDQPQLPNTKTNLGSEGSIDEIYHKTLSAYQNDIDQLNQIDLKRQEISTRIMNHQNLLHSIQGASQHMPSSSSGIKIDSIANHSAIQSNQSSHLMPPQSSYNTQVQTTIEQSAYVKPAQYQSTMITQNSRSHRGSFIAPASDASKGGATAATTSPIVGRYRLKHIQNQTNRLQHDNDATHSMTGSIQTVPSHFVEKRNKSVRPRRQTGQQAGGSNLRGGGRKGTLREEQKQLTIRTTVRPKFDSIAQAYNSTNCGREDYATNSQRSFGGLVSLIQGSQAPTTTQAEAKRSQMQTMDPPQKQTSLQQTYGLTQKLQGSNNMAQMAGVKRMTVASVPRQRHGQAFNSNLRPPMIKQTERSLSHNRNRGQNSFQQTKSIVAQHIYVSAGSGSIVTAIPSQQIQGSAQQPITSSFNPNVSGGESGTQDNVSPINTTHNRSFKYRPKQAPTLTKRNNKKSTSRGRGAIVANSTQLVGPASRKQSRITGGLPNSKEIQKTQLSQQQVYQLRGSLLQHQTQQDQDRSGHLSSDHSGDTYMIDSRLSPDPLKKRIEQRIFDPQGLNATPESPNEQSPMQTKFKLLNKITRQHTSSLRDEDADFSGQVSVGGQEIGLPASVTTQMQPFNRTHNLRYSSAVNDFSISPIDDGPNKLPVDQPSYKSGLSTDMQNRQNQAMKLINEDNPFENLKKKDSALPHSSVVMLSKPDHIMSFGDESNKSIAEKTTERESKNTTATMAGGISAGASSGNQFAFSKQSHNRRMMIGGTMNGQNMGTFGITTRRSLLGLAAMRRSETTEDSQQCMYNDSNVIMSSLPMPMESIKQVIAEEEAAEEQDERTTNKEGSRLNDGKGGQKGFSKSSSSNKEKVSSDETKRQLSSPIVTMHSEKSIRDESNVIIVDDSDSVRHSESGGVVMLMSERNTANKPKSEREASSFNKHNERPQSSGQSARYSARDHSERGNMLCESESSVQHQKFIDDDSSGVIGDILTPDVIANKDFNSMKLLGNQRPSQRDSYSRGAFQAAGNRFMAEWPAPISESSMSVSKKNKGSDAHSDDEVEVRRGLESEHVRTDMGSNPELLRQSTHSLLHKPNQAKAEEKEFGVSSAVDIIVLKKPTKHTAESNENLIQDEIDVDLSRISKKRVGITRNNNYFSAEEMSQVDKPITKTANKHLNNYSDEEEEFIVGKVDDVEVFKFGKIK